MEEYYGKHYEMVSTENFEELLIFLEIGYFRRQMAKTLRPVQFLVQNEDGTYSLHFQCALVKYQLVFVPGEEFDETKPDGTKERLIDATFDHNSGVYLAQRISNVIQRCNAASMLGTLPSSSRLEHLDYLKTLSGLQVRAFITIEGNKIFHRQVETNGRTLNHVYEFFPDKLTLTTTAPGLEQVVKRHYVAVK